MATTRTQPGPAGRHPVESTEPPATARELGLTRATQTATGPEPVAVVPPPMFRESRRRPPATEPASGPESRPGSSPGADDSQTGSEPAGSDAESSRTTPGSSFPASTDEPAPSWRERLRGGRQGATGAPPPLRDMPELRDGIAQVVHAVGDELNDRVAPGTTLFLTDEHDEQGFARPASRLILRHMPADLGASSNPDFADVVAAGIVLVRYAVKQLNLMRALRREARDRAAAGQVPYGTPPAPESGEAAA